jgi:hypothetical protein
MAAIDAFFSWTEHMFIHLAILTIGKAFSDRVVAEWNVKFKLALDIAGDPVMRLHYDELVQLKRRLHNFVTHGAPSARQARRCIFTRVPVRCLSISTLVAPRAILPDREPVVR